MARSGLAQQQQQQQQLSGSLQNLDQPLQVVPPPVPPRTPQVRQPRGRRQAPVPSPRPLPPLPSRPSLVHQTSSVEDSNLGNQDVSVSVQEAPKAPSPPPRPQQQQSVEDTSTDEEEPVSVIFARCLRTSRSRDDEDEIVCTEELEQDESPGDEPGTSRSRPSSSGARLRPPLAGTAGVSADSGTGDTGSAEIQVDGISTPSQPHQPAPGIGEQEAEDYELGDQLEEMRTVTTPGSIKGKTTPKQQVKPFTKDSLDRLENKHLQLVRDYGFQPKRKTSVEDGGVLPNKFEPFPSNLYGRPLEEIDSFIYDEVS